MHIRISANHTRTNTEEGTEIIGNSLISLPYTLNLKSSFCSFPTSMWVARCLLTKQNNLCKCTNQVCSLRRGKSLNLPMAQFKPFRFCPPCLAEVQEMKVSEVYALASLELPRLSSLLIYDGLKKFWVGEAV